MQSLDTQDSHPKLKMGTRASPMAIAMAETVRNEMLAVEPSLDFSIMTFVAEGDLIKGSLQAYGGKGTFIKDLELRLLSGEIDCAVHALKDVPGDIVPHEDLALIAYMTREDPRDALILREGITEDDVKRGGVIGSSAPRRWAALKKLYPETKVKMCRGNVNSRLKKLDSGEYDAIILSYAGLERLHFEARVSRIFSTDEILPPVGQGIVTIQVRKEDIEKCRFLKQVNNKSAEIAAVVERAMLFRLQGNCHSAIAGHCSFLPNNKVNMCGMVYNLETGAFLEASLQSEISNEIAHLGTRVADELIAKGALDFMAA